MCQQVEILVVCCSEHCIGEQSFNRLPLLRLIPRPEPIFLLCEQATNMGYRDNGGFFGIPVITIRPEMCPDLANVPSKFQPCLSSATSRKVMETLAKCRIQCSGCRNSGHAGLVSIQDDRDIPQLSHGCDTVTEGMQRIEGEWTCCAAGECSDDMCEYRAAAILCRISEQARKADQAVANAVKAEDDDLTTIEVRGYCGGCNNCRAR